VAEVAGTVEARDTAGVDNWSEVVHNLVAVATAVMVAAGIVDTVALTMVVAGIVAVVMVVVVAYYYPQIH
jgi:hypothetical protein